VRYKCWEEDEIIKQFMIREGFGNNFDKLLSFFEKKLEPIYRSYNKTLICWQELLLDQNEFTVNDISNEGTKRCDCSGLEKTN
jgi:hypothetical protein